MEEYGRGYWVKAWASPYLTETTELGQTRSLSSSKLSMVTLCNWNKIRTPSQPVRPCLTWPEYLFEFLFFVFLGPRPWYESSQARGLIGAGAVAASLHHSSQQCWILNSPERGQRSNLCPHGYVRFTNYWAMTGTPELLFFNLSA